MKKAEILEHLENWFQKFDENANFKIQENGGYYMKYTSEAKTKFEVERDFKADQEET